MTKIYDGTEKIHIGISDIPYFLIFSFNNLTNEALYNIHPVFHSPAASDTIITRIKSFNLNPFESKKIYFAYNSDVKDSITCFTSFIDGDNDIYALTNEVEISPAKLPEITAEDLEIVFRDLNSKKIELDSSCSKIEIVNKLQDSLHFSLQKIYDSTGNTDFWGNFGRMVFFDISKGIVIMYSQFMENLINFPEILAKTDMKSNHNLIYYKLGKLVTQLQDYIDMNWETADMIIKLGEIEFLLNKLKIVFPVKHYVRLLEQKTKFNRLNGESIHQISQICSKLNKILINE